MSSALIKRSRPETPALAADIIIEMTDRSNHPIVLIERKNPPLGWAIPGGFVDIGETVEHAAIREAEEEVCLKVELIELLGVYSDPKRDPRGHTASVVYVARASGQPRAADDAANVHIYPVSALPQQLAFDHKLILQDYVRYLESKQRRKPKI